MASEGPRSPWPPVVLRDPMDEQAFDDAVAGSARLQALLTTGEKLLPGFGPLVGDFFCGLYKLNLRLAEGTSASRVGRLRYRLVSEVASSQAFEDARARCGLRADRAAFGAMRLGQAVVEGLKKGKLLLADELEDLWRLAGERDESAELEDAQRSLEAFRDSDVDQGLLDQVADALAGESEQAQRRQGELSRRVAEAVESVGSEALQGLHDAAYAIGESFGDEGELSEIGGLGSGGGVDALALSDELSKTPGLKRLLRLAGALRAETLARRRARAPRARTEVYGVQLGADLARLLPIELCALRHPTLRRDLRRRFVERRLASYRMRGEDSLGRGPMVVLMDVSGSMAGPKIVWAKAVTLSICEVARHEGRDVAVFCFSSGSAGMRRFDLARRRRGSARAGALAEGLAGVIRSRPGGGTELGQPLQAALDLIAEGGRFETADIVIVTDGEAGLSKARVASLRAAADATRTRILGVLLDRGAHGDATLRKVCDEIMRASELSAATAAQVLRKVR